jgi:hypothetical protein
MVRIMDCAALQAVADWAVFALRDPKVTPKWLKMSQISAGYRRIGHEINCGVKLCAAH